MNKTEESSEKNITELLVSDKTDVPLVDDITDDEEEEEEKSGGKFNEKLSSTLIDDNNTDDNMSEEMMDLSQTVDNKNRILESMLRHRHKPLTTTTAVEDNSNNDCLDEDKSMVEYQSNPVLSLLQTPNQHNNNNIIITAESMVYRLFRPISFLLGLYILIGQTFNQLAVLSSQSWLPFPIGLTYLSFRCILEVPLAFIEFVYLIGRCGCLAIQMILLKSATATKPVASSAAAAAATVATTSRVPFNANRIRAQVDPIKVM